MSIYYYAKSVRPIKEELADKHKAYLACIQANVDIPKELIDIFGDEDNLTEDGIEEMICDFDGKKCTTIELKDLPKGTTMIKIYCSY